MNITYHVRNIITNIKKALMWWLSWLCFYMKKKKIQRIKLYKGLRSWEGAMTTVLAAPLPPHKMPLHLWYMRHLRDISVQDGSPDVPCKNNPWFCPRFERKVVESDTGIYFCLSSAWYCDLVVMEYLVCNNMGQVWSRIVKGWTFPVMGSWEKWDEREKSMVPS